MTASGDVESVKRKKKITKKTTNKEVKFKNKIQNINDITVEIKHGKKLMGKAGSGFQQPYTTGLHAYSAV